MLFEDFLKENEIERIWHSQCVINVFIIAMKNIKQPMRWCGGRNNQNYIHHANQEEKKAKEMFHNFHLLLGKKNITTSICVLTIRILIVEAFVVRASFYVAGVS